MKDIAVVGLSCRFPGANSYEEFWKNLTNGVNSVTEVPTSRWNWQDFYGEPKQGVNKTNSKWGGFLSNAEMFDAAFFGISPREAEQMDPQQRIALELAWQCIDNAGYQHNQLSGKDIGVFVGVSTFDYKELQEKYSPSIEGHSATGIHNTIVPNRISYFFNFFGPSISIDSACAGSLVSIHQAVNSIRSGECEAALAGGVSILATPTTFIRFSKVGMLSPTGSCKAFDDGADGYVRGEGGGFIFLKPLEQALLDKDNIWGVIKGSAINHGGRARSITAPSALSQSKVITAALTNAGVSPATIGFVEAHGTGTPLGDPIEILGLSRAFNAASKKEGIKLDNNYCGISAVKTNIGHLEAAAGIAGCIKTLMVLKHKLIPGNANFNVLNSRIKLEGTPFDVVSKLRAWSRFKDADNQEIPLRAGVSSFGFGGVNCHLVLEEAPATQVANKDATQSTPLLLCVSAHSQQELKDLKNNYIELIKSGSAYLSDIVNTINTCQTQLPFRDAVFGNSREELIEGLEAEISTPAIKNQSEHKIGFMFTGQGSQYLGMGLELFKNIPVFRKYFIECDNLFRNQADINIHSILSSENAERLDSTKFSQPAIFTIEYALAKTLLELGITPEILIGHSIGELVAACVADVMSLSDAVLLVSVRARLMGSVPDAGGMVAVFADSQTVKSILDNENITLDIAAINAPDNTVASGTLAGLSKLRKILLEKNIDYRDLNVSNAFHSSLMEPIQAEFYEAIKSIKYKAPKFPIVSNVNGNILSAEDFTAQYWVDHIRRPVNFLGGIETATEQNVNLWIEVGPTPVLTSLLKRHSITKPFCCLSGLKPGVSDVKNLFSSLASLYASGFALNLACLSTCNEVIPQKPVLPTRKFVGNPYWITQPAKSESPSKAGSLLSIPTSSEVLLGGRLHIAGKNQQEFNFFSEYSSEELSLLKDHSILGKPVMPGAAFISMALSAAEDVLTKSANAQQAVVSDIHFIHPLIIDGSVGLQTVIKATDNTSRFSFDIWSMVTKQDNQQDNNWIQNVKGTINLTEKSINSSLSDVDVLKNVPKASREFYADIAPLGFEYQKAFQGITASYASKDKAFAKIQVNSEGINPKFEFLKIRALDSIFQAALPLFVSDTDVSANTIPLPFEVKEVTFYKGIPEECFVIVETSAEKLARGILEFDLNIVDLSHQVLGRITGLKLKSMQKSILTSGIIKAQPEIDFCFAPHFVEVDSGNLLETPIKTPQNPVLIFCNAESLKIGRHLKEAIKGKDIFIISADADLSNDPEVDFHLNDYQKLNLEKVIGVYKKIDAIYYMGGFFDNRDLVETTLDTKFVARAKHQAVIQFVQLSQSLIKLGLTDTGFSLNVVTNGTTCLPQDKAANPWGSTVVGAAKVFAKEYPSVSVINVDIAVSDLEKLETQAGYIARFEKHPEKDGDYALRNGLIYRREFNKIQLDNTNQIELRAKGVYLIIGGAGGIGFSLSKYLANNYGSNLVWLGRRDLDETITEKISCIKDLGGDVIYLKSDITDSNEITLAVNNAGKKFGAIHGVFHSALVLDDCSIASLTEERLNNVLASKYEGCINIYNSVKDRPLDFITFFSSANSVVANKGQANYVAASTFEDAFATALSRIQNIPVKLINWGYCGDVGIVASKQYKDRLLSQGIESITDGECTEIIKQCLGSSFTHIIPFKAKQDLYNNIGFNTLKKETVSESVTVISSEWERETQAEDINFKGDIKNLSSGHKALDNLTADLILKTYELLLNKKSDFVNDELIRKLCQNPAHEKFVIASLEILESNGYLRKDGNSYSFNFNPVVRVSWADLEQQKNNLLNVYPWLESEVAISWQCGYNLEKILSGTISSTEIIFPDMSMNLVEGVYKHASLSRYFNRQTAKILASAVNSISQYNNAKIIRIIEIGAGTGSTTHDILEAIKSSIAVGSDIRVEYVYTDISNAFLQYGSLHYEQDYPFLKFSLLDVTNHPASQGFTKNSFDIVVASNVLHATPQLKNTLFNIKWLMKKNSVLVLNELTRKKNYLTLTFGLLNGWWLSNDLERRISNSPLLSPESWKNLLLECGFTEFNECPVDKNIQDCKYQSVMSCRSDGHLFESISNTINIALAEVDESDAKYPYVGAEDIVLIPQGVTKTVFHESLMMYLRWQLVDVLKISINSLFETRLHFREMLLSELGLDSLTAMDLRNRFKQQLKIDVPVEILLGGGNVTAIVEHLYKQLLLLRLKSEGTNVSQKTNGTLDNNENIEEFLI